MCVHVHTHTQAHTKIHTRTHKNAQNSPKWFSLMLRLKATVLWGFLTQRGWQLLNCDCWMFSDLIEDETCIIIANCFFESPLVSKGERSHYSGTSWSIFFLQLATVRQISEPPKLGTDFNIHFWSFIQAFFHSQRCVTDKGLQVALQ